MSKSDELRSRLPQLAAEMYEQIGIALERIRREASQPPVGSMAGVAWANGMADALRLLRGCNEAHEQFRKWLRDVIAQEPDNCGLTSEERQRLLGRPAA